MSALQIAPVREGRRYADLAVLADGETALSAIGKKQQSGAQRPHLYIVKPNVTKVSAEAVPTTPKRTASAGTSVEANPHRLGAGIRKVVFAVLTFAAMVGAGASIGGLLATPETVPVAGVTTVDPGESLWTIAAQMQVPGQRVDQVVSKIMELNQMESSAVVVGQTLKLPKFDK